jgi:hypothetical protein
MLHTLRFFSLQNAVYFIMVPFFFGSCIIRILHTGCAKILMPNYCAKRLTPITQTVQSKIRETCLFVVIRSLRQTVLIWGGDKILDRLLNKFQALNATRNTITVSQAVGTSAKFQATAVLTAVTHFSHHNTI